MITKFYGKTVPVQKLRESAQIGKEGVNLLGIGIAAESIGFRTNAVKLTYKVLLKDAQLPCILHWNKKHFVVLYKINKRGFQIADPGAGLLTFSRGEFLDQWISEHSGREGTGIALMLEPTPAFHRHDDMDSRADGSSSAPRKIFDYLVPHKRLLFQLFLGLLITSVLQLILPFLAKSMVDVGINTANLQFIYIVLLAQVALTLGRFSVEFVRSWILLHISSRINISILTDFLIKLMKLPVAFFESKRTGDILQRMNDHQRIESFLTGSSVNVVFAISNLLTFSVVLALFNTGIFLVFATASILYATWVVFFLKSRKALDYKKFSIAAKEQSTSIQLVQGMQEIKLNGMEKQMRCKWERLQARLYRLNMKILSLNQWQQSGASFINEGKNLFIVFLSANSVLDGQMTLGMMLAVQYIIGQLNSPIEQMVGFLQGWQNARISMERLNEIHHLTDEEPPENILMKYLPAAFKRQVLGGGGMVPTESSINWQTDRPLSEVYIDARLSQDVTSATSPKIASGMICFNNVSFAYQGAGNEPVLENFHLQIPKGKTTAIVGRSGSGKTTMVKLLLKLYEPQRGKIMLDNIPLSSISHSVWRSHCGVVTQESYIFSDTIAGNIAAGIERSTIDLDKLYQAACIANLHDFIENLPLGFETQIGAEGMGLSMGQKQRILIARAVYRDPDFIFLDEATNSLDSDNERCIVQNLASFLKNRTVIVVAHRLSTVKHADQIVFLCKGVMTEKGTHKELINLKGGYFSLVKNQLELGE